MENITDYFVESASGIDLKPILVYIIKADVQAKAEVQGKNAATSKSKWIPGWHLNAFL